MTAEPGVATGIPAPRGPALLAAALLVAAALVVLSSGRPVRERLRSGVGDRVRRQGGRGHAHGPRRVLASLHADGSLPFLTSLPVAAALAGAVVLATVVGGPVAGVFAGTYGALAVRARRTARGARCAREVATALEDLVSGLEADVRAGLLPAHALPLGVQALASTESAPSLAEALGPAVRATATGDDVAAALHAVVLPGAEAGSARLAAAWRVAERSGAPLAEVLGRLHTDLSAVRRRRNQVTAYTEAATTTVRMLAVLPVLGLGLGYALGGDPVAFLLHTGVGAVVAVLALALQVAGLLWAERLAAAPARSGR